MPYPVGENIFYPGDITVAEEAFFIYWGVPDVGTSPLQDEAIAIANGPNWGADNWVISIGGPGGTYQSEGYPPE